MPRKRGRLCQITRKKLCQIIRKVTLYRCIQFLKNAMQNDEPRPKSVGAAVADLLRDAILTREFVDGERLPEVAVCEKYGVSRIPLREAFQILASEGLIVSTANRGARVRTLTRRDMDQIFHLRQLLETDCADASI